jgi:hypothetical protein
MSATPSRPEPTPRSQLNNALLWLVGSVVIAALAFYRGLEGDEKKTFYLIAGVIAVIAAIVNGYAAMIAYKKTQSPPPA